MVKTREGEETYNSNLTTQSRMVGNRPFSQTPQHLDLKIKIFERLLAVLFRDFA